MLPPSGSTERANEDQVAPVCAAPEAEDNRWTLTFDSVTTVKGDLAINLGLVWLDNDEQSPRHGAVELPLGPRVLEGREGALVGTRSKRWPGSMRGKRKKMVRDPCVTR